MTMRFLLPGRYPIWQNAKELLLSAALGIGWPVRLESLLAEIAAKPAAAGTADSSIWRRLIAM